MQLAPSSYVHLDVFSRALNEWILDAGFSVMRESSGGAAGKNARERERKP